MSNNDKDRSEARRPSESPIDPLSFSSANPLSRDQRDAKVDNDELFVTFLQHFVPSESEAEICEAVQSAAIGTSERVRLNITVINSDSSINRIAKIAGPKEEKLPSHNPAGMLSDLGRVFNDYPKKYVSKKNQKQGSSEYPAINLKKFDEWVVSFFQIITKAHEQKKQIFENITRPYELKEGHYLSTLEKMPSDLQNYLNSYIWVNQKLYYVQQEGFVSKAGDEKSNSEVRAVIHAKEVEIKDREKFILDLAQINTHQKNKLRLTDEQVASLITANGDHKPISLKKSFRTCEIADNEIKMQIDSILDDIVVEGRRKILDNKEEIRKGILDAFPGTATKKGLKDLIDENPNLSTRIKEHLIESYCNQIVIPNISTDLERLLDPDNVLMLEDKSNIATYFQERIYANYITTKNGIESLDLRFTNAFIQLVFDDKRLLTQDELLSVRFAKAKKMEMVRMDEGLSELKSSLSVDTITQFFKSNKFSLKSKREKIVQKMNSDVADLALGQQIKLIEQAQKTIALAYSNLIGSLDVDVNSVKRKAKYDERFAQLNIEYERILAAIHIQEIERKKRGVLKKIDLERAAIDKFEDADVGDEKANEAFKDKMEKSRALLRSNTELLLTLEQEISAVQRDSAEKMESYRKKKSITRSKTLKIASKPRVFLEHDEHGVNVKRKESVRLENPSQSVAASSVSAQLHIETQPDISHPLDLNLLKGASLSVQPGDESSSSAEDVSDRVSETPSDQSSDPSDQEDQLAALHAHLGESSHSSDEFKSDGGLNQLFAQQASLRESPVDEQASDSSASDLSDVASAPSPTPSLPPSLTSDSSGQSNSSSVELVEPAPVASTSREPSSRQQPDANRRPSKFDEAMKRLATIDRNLNAPLLDNKNPILIELAPVSLSNVSAPAGSVAARPSEIKLEIKAAVENQEGKLDTYLLNLVKVMAPFVEISSNENVSRVIAILLAEVKGAKDFKTASSLQTLIGEINKRCQLSFDPAKECKNYNLFLASVKLLQYVTQKQGKIKKTDVDQLRILAHTLARESVSSAWNVTVPPILKEWPVSKFDAEFKKIFAGIQKEFSPDVQIPIGGRLFDSFIQDKYPLDLPDLPENWKSENDAAVTRAERLELIVKLLRNETAKLQPDMTQDDLAEKVKNYFAVLEEKIRTEKDLTAQQKTNRASLISALHTQQQATLAQLDEGAMVSLPRFSFSLSSADAKVDAQAGKSSDDMQMSRRSSIVLDAKANADMISQRNKLQAALMEFEREIRNYYPIHGAKLFWHTRNLSVDSVRNLADKAGDLDQFLVILLAEKDSIQQGKFASALTQAVKKFDELFAVKSAELKREPRYYNLSVQLLKTIVAKKETAKVFKNPVEVQAVRAIAYRLAKLSIAKHPQNLLRETMEAIILVGNSQSDLRNVLFEIGKSIYPYLSNPAPEVVEFREGKSKLAKLKRSS